jgi:NADH-quinone oxidoreductase subunit E
MPIDEQTRAEAQALARRYPIPRAALLPMLHLVQSADGYVSADGIALCAEVLGITKAEVASVSTFYTMYKREQVGDWLLSVCTNPTCQVAGGQAIYDDYVKALGGHQDADAGVTIEHAECLGICGDAPVIQVNYEMYGRMSHAEGLALLEAARKGEPPVALSGVKPCTFREVERELSGIDDGVGAELEAAAARQAASANPPVWRSGETFIPGAAHAEGLMLDQSATTTTDGGAA